MAASVLRSIIFISLSLAVSLTKISFLYPILCIGIANAEVESTCEVDGTCSEPEDPCRDYDEKCEFWASKGECKNNPTYMKTNCLVSCNVCITAASQAKFNADSEKDADSEEVKKKEACEDLHEMCGVWAENGECMVNPAFMVSACRMSCYLCFDVVESRKLGDDEDLILRKYIFSGMDVGAVQNIPPGDQHQETIDAIKKMDKYAKEVVTLPEYNGVRAKCKNNNVQCASWSSAGECIKIPDLMIQECPLACLACDKLDQIDRCKPSTESEGKHEFFNKGSINKLFLEMKDGKLDQYSPEFITEPTSETPDDPFIVRFDSFLTEEEVDQFISLGNTIGWENSSADEVDPVESNDEQIPPLRVSESAYCGLSKECESDSIFERVMTRIADISSVPKGHLEHVELVKYSYAGSYGRHHDFIIDDKWKPAGPRVFSFLLFLSDVEEGGASGFPDLDWLFITPKKGQALLWSNVFDNDPKESNPKMVHETLPVVKGELMVAQVWVHRDNWRKEFERGCA